MQSNHGFLGLIAGEGLMPEMILKEMQNSGKKVFLLAIEGITSSELAKKAEDRIWLKPTQVGKAIEQCLKREVREVVMAGRIHHKFVFSLSLLNMDWTTLRIWHSLKDKRADTLLRAIINAFEKKGIVFLDQTFFLRDLIPSKGLLTNKSLSKSQMDDIQFGVSLAKEMGRLDIGQTVLVKNMAVVAIEAMEGTNLCIERAGSIAGKGCVCVKMAKPQQDMRFDVPIVGLTTLKKLFSSGASALAIEADKTIILDKKHLIHYANEHSIAIFAS